MSGRQSPPQRSPEYVWLVSATLTVFAVTCTVLLGLRHSDWPDQWWEALLALPFFAVLGIGLRYVQIRRHGVTLGLIEIPLVISFYFLPAILVVLVCTTAMVIKQFRVYRRPALDKLVFNVSRSAAAAAAAGIVLEVFPPIDGTGPMTW